MVVEAWLQLVPVALPLPTIVQPVGPVPPAPAAPREQLADVHQPGPWHP